MFQVFLYKDFIIWHYQWGNLSYVLPLPLQYKLHVTLWKWKWKRMVEPTEQQPTRLERCEPGHRGEHAGSSDPSRTTVVLMVVLELGQSVYVWSSCLFHGLLRYIASHSCTSLPRSWTWNQGPRVFFPRVPACAPTGANSSAASTQELWPKVRYLSQRWESSNDIFSSSSNGCHTATKASSSWQLRKHQTGFVY